MAYKKLSEATFVENIMDTANVLIEENDEIKRVPKSVMGKVKTVNGAEPDENGDVAIEIPNTGGAFVVNVTWDWEEIDGEEVIVYEKDKSFAEILTAIKNGDSVAVNEDGGFHHLMRNNYDTELKFVSIEMFDNAGAFSCFVLHDDETIERFFYEAWGGK